jgi:GH15 family glucan-1,4-alpha-glucosidase
MSPADPRAAIAAMERSSMNYGILGNCAFSALVHEGEVVWLCWPRMDSSFVFGGLLDEKAGGSFRVEAVHVRSVTQEYVTNTNVLRTTFCCEDGDFELIDFAPRFHQFERYYKPTMLARILRPLRGQPRVRVTCRPVDDYGRRVAQSEIASNHIEYMGLSGRCRLTTDIPCSYVEEGRPFVLATPAHLALTWGQPLEAPLGETLGAFLSRTIDYWRSWVRNMRVPRDYQEAVIRSALVLKLHQYEDTGAILAATTTSLPEFPGSGRNWDYRYCWLRDSYFALNAFERLGHTAEMLGFLIWLRNVAAGCESGALQPLYGISGEDRIVEQILDHLAGYRGEQPVRIGNQAYEHVQNDVYGEMILAVSRLLLDVRFRGGDEVDGAADLVDGLLQQVEARIDQPDAGLWELRNTEKLHGFTLLTHWAGARKALEVAEERGAQKLAERARTAMATARELLETRCWNEELGAFTQAADEPNLDAAMLLMLHFGFLEPDDPRAKSHVLAIRDRLQVGDLGLIRRYAVEDDFGVQKAAFTVCAFWLVEALAIVGEKDEARTLFERLLGLHNGLGLFGEDILPWTGEQSGNFPQAYSHVGLINAAFRLGRSWD